MGIQIIHGVQKLSGVFPFTSVGDVNTYGLFAEAGRSLIKRHGRSGIIIPPGVVTDNGLKGFFVDLVTKKALIQSIGFENEEFLFTGIANVNKYLLFIITSNGDGEDQPTFAFYLRNMKQFTQSERFFKLSYSDLVLLNPNTNTCPVFRNLIDSYMTKKIYLRFPIIHNERNGDNPWSISLFSMFHLSNDSGLFSSEPLPDYLPLYEAKLFWHYDHRFASYDLVGKIKGKGGRGLPDMPLGNHVNPNYTITPQYWVPKIEVNSRLNSKTTRNWLIGFRDMASAKVERTTIFSVLPRAGVGNSASLLFSDIKETPLIACLLGNLNSLVFDYFARQKVAGSHLNFFVFNQFSVLPPSSYTPTDIEYIALHVLELVYTAFDIKPFAEDMGYKGEPFRWDEERRSLLRAELDAYYARLYGLTHKQLRYILDPADLTPRELENILDPCEEIADPLDPQGYAQRCAASDFPGETFRVLKEKENKLYGEFRTRRLVLEAWERLAEQGLEIGNPEGYRGQELHDAQQEVIEIPAPKQESQPEVVKAKTQAQAPQSAEEEPNQPEAQPTLTDFGLYKCEACGKMVLGFDQEDHEREKHGGKSVEWRRMR